MSQFQLRHGAEDFWHRNASDTRLRGSRVGHDAPHLARAVEEELFGEALAGAPHGSRLAGWSLWIALAIVIVLAALHHVYSVGA